MEEDGIVTKGSTPQGSSKPTAPNPGDEAPPGTAGTGENVCPVCQGSRIFDNKPCQNCGGTGVVVEGVGGG